MKKSLKAQGLTSSSFMDLNLEKAFQNKHHQSVSLSDLKIDPSNLEIIKPTDLIVSRIIDFKSQGQGDLDLS